MLDVALVVSVLVATGVYLMLERHLLAALFGLSLLSNAANLFVLAMSGPPENLESPILTAGTARAMVDPLPQALVLTAIVIGSAILLYAIFYIHRLACAAGTLDLDEITTAGEGDAH